MDTPTKLKTLDLPGGRRLTVRAPAEPERLLDAIDAAQFKEDERMPYWAEPWPAGLALAGRLLAGDPPAPALRGRRVLELGCGLGIVGIAAALAGAAEVTLSDWFPESVEQARENALLNGVDAGRVRGLVLDWRMPPAGLAFEAIVGSDLLYETRNAAPLIACTKALLAPGGAAWIADPDRITAGDFAARAEGAGFDVRRTPLAGCSPRGWVYELRRA